MDLSLQMRRNSAIQFCMCTEALSGIGVDKRGNMGSGSIFSPWTEVPCELCEALDMCLVVDMRVDDGEEKG